MDIDEINLYFKLYLKIDYRHVIYYRNLNNLTDRSARPNSTIDKPSDVFKGVRDGGSSE